MWKVGRPTFSALRTFEVCIRTIADQGLRDRLEESISAVHGADYLYREAGERGDFDDLAQPDFSLSVVTPVEMSNLYNRKMAENRSSARYIYDALILASPQGKCPMCGHRDVTTLDHYLPKSRYPALAVNPVNLVPSCVECNKTKSSNVSATLHPYYDDIESDRWLRAEVIESEPAAIRFFVEPYNGWPNELSERVVHHFEVFRLAHLYTAQSARTISGIRHKLRRLSDVGGDAIVRAHLMEEYATWSAADMNSWEAALYQALSESDWFCRGGFRT
jgi:hypothetical protein